VDTLGIYFLGASQGTCFLHEFLMDYAENYGGGFYGGCGCYNNPNQFWKPSQALRDRFKVYIHSTQSDFLLQSTLGGYDYWRYDMGFNTRGQFSTAGGHCSATGSYEDTALSWFLGKSEIPTVFEPHWELRRADSIAGIAAAPNGGILVLSKLSGLLRSRDLGRTWDTLWHGTQTAYDVRVNGQQQILLGLKDSLYRLDTLTKKVTPILGANWLYGRVVQAGGDTLLVPSPMGSRLRTVDGGLHWTEVDGYTKAGWDDNFWKAYPNRSGTMLQSVWNYDTAWSRQYYVSHDLGTSWNLVDPPANAWYWGSLTTNGSQWLGIGMDSNYLYGPYSFYDGSGSVWSEFSPTSSPTLDTTMYNLEDVRYLPGDSLILTGSYVTLLSVDQGKSWNHMPGLDHVSGDPRMVSDQDGRLWASDGVTLRLWIPSADVQDVSIKNTTILGMASGITLQRHGSWLYVSASKGEKWRIDFVDFLGRKVAPSIAGIGSMQQHVPSLRGVCVARIIPQ